MICTEVLFDFLFSVMEISLDQQPSDFFNFPKSPHGVGRSTCHVSYMFLLLLQDAGGIGSAQAHLKTHINLDWKIIQ